MSNYEIVKISPHPTDKEKAFFDILIVPLQLVVKGFQVIKMKKGDFFFIGSPKLKTLGGATYTLICPRDRRPFEEELRKLIVQGKWWDQVKDLPRATRAEYTNALNEQRATKKTRYTKSKGVGSPPPQQAKEGALKKELDRKPPITKVIAKEYVNLAEYRRKRQEEQFNKIRGF